MEKVQIALERARQDRARALGGAVGNLQPRRNDGSWDDPDFLSAFPLLEPSPRALRRNRIVTSTGTGAANEAFRMLRTHVLGRLALSDGQALAVTSPHQGDGKTLVAINLAVAIARQIGRSAVLVDLDLRRPAIGTTLGVQPPQELSDCLSGRCEMADCLVRLGLDDLVALLQTNQLPNSSELLGSRAMVALGDEIKRRFPDRVIIYDCPPILAADDSLVIRQLVDGVLLVVREGGTSRGDLLRSAELIGEKHYLGVVLNQARWHALPAYYY